MANVRVLRPNQQPLVEVDSFENYPDLRNTWQATSGLEDYRHIFLGDHYWRFNQEDEVGYQAARAIGRLIFGITDDIHYSEFARVGSLTLMRSYTQNEISHEVAYLALCVPIDHQPYDPTRTATGLIAATNEDLRALNSPYQLPLPEA